MRAKSAVSSSREDTKPTAMPAETTVRTLAAKTFRVCFRWVDQGHDRNSDHGRHEPKLQIWTVSDGNGFQVLRFTDSFKQSNRDLFEESVE
jgi:hypothetical protein